jgi:ABC-type uncharacterized transport system YnjBCD permease subunit
MILGLIVAGAFALALYEGQRAEVLQAQALIEANRTARAATATLTLVLVLIVLAVLAAIALYVYVRYRQWQRQRREGYRRPPRRLAGYPSYSQSQSSSTDRMLERMVQLQTLQMMRDLQPPQPRTPVLSAYYDDEPDGQQDQGWF